MLSYYFPKIKENRVVQTLGSFLYSPYYLIAVVALMVASNLFGLELPVYYVYGLFCVLISLFAEDTFSLIPMICCGYMTFSKKSNPLLYPDTNFLASTAGKVQLIVIIVLIALALIARLLHEVIVVRREKTVPKLTLGYFVLGLAYVLGGAFSPYYTFKTIAFGLVQIASIGAFYFYLYFTVDWSKRNAVEYATVFTAVGVGLLIEILALYFTPTTWAALRDGTFERGMIRTGWGTYNNLGGMMAMLLPAPFCLATLKKQGWIFNLLGNVFFLGLILTQSRSSILFGGFVYFCSVAICLVFSKGKERIFNAVVFGVTALAGIVVAIYLREQLLELFHSLLYMGSGDNGRSKIYEVGIQQFKDYPVFGNGFYECKYAWIWGQTHPGGGFLPERYHNTVVQILASCGTVGMAAYLLHRVQTGIMLFRELSIERLFVTFSMLALLLTSMLDCHFFNMGPGLLYACMLVLAEKGRQSHYLWKKKEKSAPIEEVETKEPNEETE